MQNIVPGNREFKDKQYIAFAAGKSGGHIVPCLTMARQELQNNPNTGILFFTTDGDLDKSIIESSQDVVEVHESLVIKQLPRTFFSIFSFAWEFTKSLWKSLTLLYRYYPKKVVSTGGIVALPVCIAAFVLRIPIELYELNATPGNAIIKLSMLANKVYYCFQGLDKWIPACKLEYHPYPVRYTKDEFCHDVVSVKRGLQFDEDKKKTIFILGGSQGSVFLNEMLEAIFSKEDCFKEDFQFIHQTGHAHVDQVRDLYAKYNVKAYVFDYMPNLSSFYSAADLIVARAGAGTIFEVDAFKKPCILIPLETQITDHQLDNAMQIAKQRPQKFFVLRQYIVRESPEMLSQMIKEKIIN